MRNGHRRTQSDNYYCNFFLQKPEFKLSYRQNQNQISNLLKQNSRKNKTKTVCVQSLDIPQTKSQYDLMFYFGRKGYQTPTGTSTQFDEEILYSIPEKKQKAHLSLRKSTMKQQKNTYKKLWLQKMSKMVSPISSKFQNSPRLTSVQKNQTDEMNKNKMNLKSSKDRIRAKGKQQKNKKTKGTKNKVKII